MRISDWSSDVCSSDLPLAGQSMTGADMLVQILADEGVEVVFGYSGGAILPSYDAIFRYNARHTPAGGSEPMPLIVPANEQAAGFMAAGFARASGQVGARGEIGRAACRARVCPYV